MKQPFGRMPGARVLVALAVISLGLAACGGSDDGDDTDNELAARAYNGPGSKWDATLRPDGTFTITRRLDATSPVIMTVNGDYQELPSGFLHFVVSSASGTDAPSAGDEAYGLEVEGYALMLKPVDPTSDQVIPMVTSGSCPDTDVAANWVLVRKPSSDDATDAGRDFFGTFEYEVATDTPSLPSRYALDNSFTSQGAGTIPGTGSCADGLMLVTDAEMFLTASGGAIVHTNLTNPSESSFIFALAQSPIAAIGNTDGSYAGLLFDGGATSGDRIQPVALTCGSGTCTGNIVTDVENNTLSAESVTVDLSGTVDALGDGLVTGTITSGSGTGNLACMVDTDANGSGRKIMSCVGQAPGDNTQMFNVLLIS